MYVYILYIKGERVCVYVYICIQCINFERP